MRRGGAGILVPSAPLAQVARAALSRDERDRVPNALFRRTRRPREGLLERRALRQGGLERVLSRKQGVEHRLVSWLGLPTHLHSGDPGLERGGPVLRTEL